MILLQVLFQDGKFQWKRLENLISLAKEGSGGLDLSDTVRDGARVLISDEKLRTQLLLALTEDNRLHVEVRQHPPKAPITGFRWELMCACSAKGAEPRCL